MWLLDNGCRWCLCFPEWCNIDKKNYTNTIPYSSSTSTPTYCTISQKVNHSPLLHHTFFCTMVYLIAHRFTYFSILSKNSLMVMNLSMLYSSVSLSKSPHISSSIASKSSLLHPYKLGVFQPFQFWSMMERRRFSFISLMFLINYLMFPSIWSISIWKFSKV